MAASVEAVRKAIAELAEAGEGDFVGPIPDVLVAKAEDLLGVTFPSGYRTFVASLGCGDVGGREFYGLIGEPVDKGPVPNTVWYTRQLRRDGLDGCCVAVCEPGDGTVLVIDTRDAEENVLIWLPGAPDTEAFGQTFGEMFLEAVREATQP